MRTHSDRIERWLGADNVAHLSNAMRGWYGPPIALMGVPGNVEVCGDGDFRGRIMAGAELSALERAHDLMRAHERVRNVRLARAMKQMGGFASLSDLIAEATAGKRRDFLFQKAGPTGVTSATSSLWRVGNVPVAGAAAAAAPGGTVPVDSDTGAFFFDNPSGGDTQHFVTGFSAATNQGTLLMYDRIFAVAKTMNSTSTEAVTGVPSRYQSTTATAADYAGGNFLFPECRTVLPATAHNWTVCTYTDQDGNTGATLPSITGNSSNAVNRLDMPTGMWFAPLASGDFGIKALTQMQCSAAVATGAIDFVIGHPIAWMPCPFAQVVCVTDGINTAFSMARIFDDACLAFLDVMKPSSTAVTYTGTFTTVRG